MFGRKARKVRSLQAIVDKLSYDLATECIITETLRKALTLAMDPEGMAAEYVEKMMFDRAAEVDLLPIRDEAGQIVEWVMPEKYDWDALARAIVEDEQRGDT